MIAGAVMMCFWLMVAYIDMRTEAEVRRERMQLMCEPPVPGEVLVQALDADGAPLCRYYIAGRRR